jgi:hypothetical protein
MAEVVGGASTIAEFAGGGLPIAVFGAGELPTADRIGVGAVSYSGRALGNGTNLAVMRLRLPRTSAEFKGPFPVPTALRSLRVVQRGGYRAGAGSGMSKKSRQ